MYFKSLILVLIFSFSCLQLDSQESLLDGIVAYYPFDGDARDLSINCLHGKIYGCKNDSGINGKFMTALSFDGKDDYIEIPNDDLLNFDFDDDFAFSFWIDILDKQIDQDTFDNDIISKWVFNGTDDYKKTGYPYSVRLFNQKHKKFKNRIHFIQFGGYTKDCRGSSTLLDRKDALNTGYNQVLVNVKNGRIYLYINNIVVDRRGNNVFCSTVNEAPLLIGKRGGVDFKNYFSGKIDNLAIFDRALTEEEITKLSKKDFDLGVLILLAKESRKEIRSDTLYFDSDVFELDKKQKTVLSKYIEYLSESTEYEIEIRGHTNGIPGDKFCEELSFQRAKVVEAYLSDSDIHCNQIFTKGMGKREQIAPNNTLKSRKLNQRVDFRLFYLGKS